jgi:hypothetical protein
MSNGAYLVLSVVGVALSGLAAMGFHLATFDQEVRPQPYWVWGIVTGIAIGFLASWGLR